MYSALGVPQTLENQVTILKIEKGSPAETGGLKVEDRVLKVESRKVENGDEFGRLMRSWAGLEVNLTVRRGKGTQLLEGITQDSFSDTVIKVTPRENPPEGQGPVGVGIADYPYISVEKCQMSDVKCQMRSIPAGIRATGVWMAKVVEGLRGIGKSLVAGKAPEGVEGTVGIY